MWLKKAKLLRNNYNFSMAIQKEFPTCLLKDICWNFTERAGFNSRDEFEDALKRYTLEAFEDEEGYNFDDEYNPQEIVLESPVVIINYYADPPNEDEGFHVVQIISDNKTNFSNSELLYKFHNLAINQLKESGHCYFEGLDFVETDERGIPIYEMIGGS
jgi:hypothetical protein